MHSGDVSTTTKPNMTPEELCKSIYWSYSGEQDAYTIKMQDKEVYRTKDQRDASLFIAELKAFIVLQGSQQESLLEASPVEPPPKKEPKVLRSDELTVAEISWYSSDEFLPLTGVRVMVYDGAFTVIARRVTEDGDWYWIFDSGARASISEVELWAPIPIKRHEPPKEPPKKQEPNNQPNVVGLKPTPLTWYSPDLYVPPLDVPVLVRIAGDVLIGKRIMFCDWASRWELSNGKIVDMNAVSFWIEIPAIG